MGVLAEEEMVGGWWVAVAPMAEKWGGHDGTGEVWTFGQWWWRAWRTTEAVAWAEATTVV